MSTIQVAASRRLNEVQRLQKIVVLLDRDIAAGPRGASGMDDSYLAKRLIELKAEREKLLSEMAELEALDGDQLVERFNPITPPVEGVPLRDLLGRGEMPRQAVVHKNPPPVIRHGGDPRPADPAMLPAGYVPGTTHYPDYSNG